MGNPKPKKSQSKSDLRNGVKRANGGRREGAGRKPDWLKLTCQKILDKDKLLQYLAGVAAGREIEQQVVVVRDGRDSHTEVVDVRCSTKDRLRALEMILERGWGKPAQPVELDAEMKFQPFNITIREIASHQTNGNGAVHANGSNGKNGHTPLV